MNNIMKKRKTYKDMIDFCCDSLILNNEIVSEYNRFYSDLEIFGGSDYDKETDEFIEIFQFFIIGDRDAERLASYTNEIVYFLPKFEMYVLGVTHFGTCWDGVPSNWKESQE